MGTGGRCRFVGNARFLSVPGMSQVDFPCLSTQGDFHVPKLTEAEIYRALAQAGLLKINVQYADFYLISRTSDSNFCLATFAATEYLPFLGVSFR